MWLLLSLFGVAFATDWDVNTVLDEYVNRVDPNYGYYPVAQYSSSPDVETFVLNMTSQQWFDESLTTTPIWWHFLAISIPKVPQITDTALLYITGGNRYDSIPDSNHSLIQRSVNYSNRTGSVSAIMWNVPNQPMVFTNDPEQRNRTEDGIIAYTWKLYIEENVTDPSVNLLFPMAKAAKAAVDTIVDFAQLQDSRLVIDKIMPSGFSKRGWTAWLSACTDQRVFAAAPIVFDLLNSWEVLRHQFQCLDGWTWAFFQYWENGVAKYLNNPRAIEIIGYIDPFEYNERLTMPKLVQLAAGDQFFLLDDTHYFWRDLTPPKYMTMYENDDHGLNDHEDIIWNNFEAFLILVSQNLPLPDYDFSYDEDHTGGWVTLNTNTNPEWVKAWTAETTNKTCFTNINDTDGQPFWPDRPCRRDFRLDEVGAPSETGILWVDTPADNPEPGVYSTFSPYQEEQGFVALHLQMSYPVAAQPVGGNYQRSLVTTTMVNIIPDWLPFRMCITEEQCRGILR